MQSTDVRIGTRGSPLALVQAEETRRLLAAALDWTPERIVIVPIRTSGDRITDRPLTEAGGKGLFTKEIEQALIARRIDLAVHSLKDMETFLPEGLAIVCVLPTSEPPAVSVIHWPESHRLGASRASRCGSARSEIARFPEALSAVAAPSLIASGHV